MTSSLEGFSREQIEAYRARAQTDLEGMKFELQVQDAEESLIDFAEFMWPVIEPGRPFVRGWALEAICEHLEAVSRGDIQNILFNVPPGTMKSLSTNVLWPCWEWGPQKKPHLRYVSAAYSQSLTIRDNRRSRLIVQSERYQQQWPVALVGDQNEKIKFENEATGFRLATSVGGTVMGERGDRVIVDDPNDTRRSDSETAINEALQWFTEVLPTRVNDLDKTPIIVIMQRVNERDVSGHILASELGYEHLCLPMEFDPVRRCHSIIKPSYMDNCELAEVARVPGTPGVWVTRDQADQAFQDLKTENEDLIEANPFALELKAITPDQLEFVERYPVDPRTEHGELLFPERFPRAAVDRLKKTLASWGGQYAIAGQLDQRPTPRGGGLFKRENLRIVDAEAAPKGGRSVRGWDLAATDEKEGGIARTAGVKMRITPEGTIVIEDAVFGKWGPGEVETKLIETAEEDGIYVPQDIPQDPGQAGKSQKRALAIKLAKFEVRFSPETGSKVDRARPLAAAAENGLVILVRGSWNDAFLAEAETFPRGKTKDLVDAATRAYSRALMEADGDLPTAIGPGIQTF
jgi:predicted phage terminase large subunit-like protein